jgi:hypothetical protein
VNTQDIIEQIDSEISKLQQAKALLIGATAASTKRGPGGPKANDVVTKILAVKPPRKPLGTEAKEKIAAAQRLRWAKSKRAAKKAARAVKG